MRLVVLFVGFAGAFAFAWTRVGGTAGLQELGATIQGYLVPCSGGGSGWPYLMLLVPGFIVSPGLVQKVFAARDEAAVRKGMLLCGGALRNRNRALHRIAAGAGGSREDRAKHDRHAHNALTLAGMYGPRDMPLCYVRDFMRGHAGQLVFVSGRLEQSRVNTNKSAR